MDVSISGGAIVNFMSCDALLWGGCELLCYLFLVLMSRS